MPQPNDNDFLTLEERHIIHEALANEVLMSGLVKIMRFQERDYDERARAELLKRAPDFYEAVRHSTRAEAAREHIGILKDRVKLLSGQAHG